LVKPTGERRVSRIAQQALRVSDNVNSGLPPVDFLTVVAPIEGFRWAYPHESHREPRGDAGALARDTPAWSIV